jgi:rubrerythrin
MPIPPHVYRDMFDEIEDEKPWTCPKCQHVNKVNTDMCEKCNSFRPVKITLAGWHDSEGRVY